MGLTISRMKGEYLDIVLPDGRVIGVQYLFTKSGKARLTVEADKDIKIHRREWTAAKEAERKAAS